MYFSSHPKSQFWSKKNKINPNKVALYSNKKYLFNCDKCNHEFSKILNDIVGKNSWCPYCKHQKICSCKICFKKSFASHHKSKYWSNKNKISPNLVFKKTLKKYLFNCNNCKHNFYMSLANITHNNNWCSYCSNKKLCENNNCTICFKKSFSSNPKSKYILDINPRTIFKNSHKLYDFNCNNCKHIFRISLLSVNINNSWCSYCANKKLCKDNNCKICFEKSFVSHHKSKYWSNKNNMNPREVFKNSHKKYLFECDKKHLFKIQLDHITNLNNWCNKCNETKGENNITNYLVKYNIKHISQKKFKKLKYKRLLRYDFYLIDYNLLIEYDGEQHFNNNTRNKHFNKTYKIRRFKDILKNKYCLEHKINLLRISFKEYFYIENIINATINKIKKEKYIGIIYSNLKLYKFPK